MATEPSSTGGEGEGVGGGEVEPRNIPANLPLETGIYTTMTLLDAFRIREPVPSFIRDLFFSGRDFVNSNVVQIDTYRGGKNLAPFVLPLEGQVIGRRKPFRRDFVEAPIIAPAREITLRDVNTPSWGETPYTFKSPEERFADMLANDSDDMDDEIARTEEFMCCSCMVSGQIPINYRNKTNVVIDYGFTNTTVVSKYWTDPTADPLGDLRLAQQGLNANNYGGNIAVYSVEAWNALWSNPNVQNTMKNVAPQFAPISGISIPEITNGVARGPDFTNPVMQNWIYSGTYTAGGAGLTTPYVPKGKVIIGSPQTKNRLVYAQVTQIEQEDGRFHSYLMDRVPKLECNVNKNFFLMTITSRPVPVPVDLLSWSVLSGTVAP